MKKRIHLKRKSRIKINKVTIFIITFISVLVLSLILLNKISKRFTPILLEIAETEINKFSTVVVNKAISQVLEDKINTENLFDTIISNSGEIQTIDFNPIIVNQVLNVATTVVQNN